MIFWFWFILKEDPHPEPRGATALAFLLGAVAVLLSYYGETGLEIIGFNSQNTPKAYFFYSALVEEFFKFALVALVIFRLRVFDEPVDAMVYMGFAALGFAFSENFLGLANLENGSLSTIFIVALLRSLGANFLHMLASILIGFGYIYSKLTRRLFPFGFSAAMAVILHFIYNLFIIQDGLTFYIFPILWAVFFVVLKEFDLIKLKNERVILPSTSRTAG